MAFFMLMFCLSGILLNHRSLISHVDVSRKYLPSRYEFKNWNGGLLRGTLPIDSLQLLLYGNGGIWLTNSKASYFKDFNEGLPSGADFRQIRNVVKIAAKQSSPNDSVDPCEPDNIIFALSPFALYRYGLHGAWHEVRMPLAEDEKLTDVACHGDTLVVLSREFVYTSLPPYTSFSRLQLQAPSGYDAHVSLFRTIWLLHSGELFGTPGKLFVDCIALALVMLCLTGLVFWLRPKHKLLLKHSLLLHDRLGRYTIVLTLLIALTGWCLRPPVMIALVMGKTPAMPGTTLHSPNPWHDKLRMLSYDEACHDWLLSTSEGFYSMSLDGGVVRKISSAPPVSVMGLNVLQKDKSGKWLCGSFSGLFVWDRRHATSIDYFTHKPAPKTSGPPFGKKAIAGMSQDFQVPVVAEYYEGPSFAPHPATMNHLPMSLWNVALEVHSGRLFIGSIATYVFIFVMGLLALWCLWSGYSVRM